MLKRNPDEQDAIFYWRGLALEILKQLNTHMYYSRDMANYMGVPQAILKPILREMRLDGLVQFSRGNLNEDGEVYGSGHYITEAGRKFLKDNRIEYDKYTQTAKL